MKRFFFLLVFIALCSFSISAAQDFWHQAKGTEGGNISLLAIRGDGTAFASDGKSLFRRSLKDAQWSERTVPKDRIITAIIIDAYGAVIVGTNGGVYRSATDGDSWGLMGLDSFVISKIFYDSKEGLFALYHRTYDILHFSHFNLQTKVWNDFRSNLKDKEIISFDTTGVWYIASDNLVSDSINKWGSVLKRSFDKGKTWENVTTFFPYYSMDDLSTNTYSLIIQKSNRIWLGASGWYYGDDSYSPVFYRRGGIINSSDGEKWKGTIGVENIFISPVLISQDSSGKLFAGTTAGLYSHIGGEYWELIGLQDYEILSIAIDKEGNIIAAVSEFLMPRRLPRFDIKQYRLFFLKKGTTEWQPYHQNIHAGTVNRIAVDKSGKLVAATNNGVFISYKNTENWRKIYDNDASAVTFDNDGNIYAGNEYGGVFKVEEDTTISLTGFGTYIHSLEFFHSHLYATSRGKQLWPTKYEPGTAFKTNDTNKSTWNNQSKWTGLSNSLHARTFFKTDNELFLLKKGEHYENDVKPEFFKANYDSFDTLFKRDVFAITQTNGNLYLATDSGIYRRDGEKIFTKLNFLFKTTALTTANDGVMYAASGSKVYRSADEWQTWEDVSKGMRGDVTQLAVTKDGFLVAGTRGNGLFVSNQRTYSALKITNVVKECGRHTVTIEGDSLNNFISTLENVKIDVLKTLPASTVDVLISQEDRFKNGSYDVEFSDALGRKIVLKNSFPAVIPPVITQKQDTLYSSIPAQSYEWLESGEVIPGETKEFLKLRKPGVYSLKIIDTNSCELLSESLAVTAVGIENEEVLIGFSAEFLKENDEIVIVIPGSRKSTVSIISLNGEVLFKKECSVGEVQVRVPASQFSQGVYFVRYTAGNDSFGRLLSVIK